MFLDGDGGGNNRSGRPRCFGGIRNGMVMSWPKRIKDRGGLREQFHHVIDIMPTILDAVGVQAPTSINGVKQAPIDGTSMVYTWDDVNAKGKRTTQYFELFGNRGKLYEHMREAFQRTNVSALAVGSLFNFGDNNPIRAKAHLSNHGIPFKVV